MILRRRLFVALFFVLLALALPAAAQTPAVPPGALLPATVSGLEKTGATAVTLPVAGQPFPTFLRVTMTKPGAAVNDTQIVVPLMLALKKGDTLGGTVYVRGRGTNGSPAEANLLVIKNAPPWNNSGTARLQSVVGKPDAWRRVALSFTATDDYAPGAAVVCVHLASAAQTIDLGGLTVTNYGGTVSREDLQEKQAAAEPTRTVSIAVDRRAIRQTMVGFGGNFVLFGDGAASDAVSTYLLRNLRTDHARVGIVFKQFLQNDGTLDRTKPALGGVYAFMKTLQAKRIPLVASVWDLPDSFVTNPKDGNGRRIAPDKRDAVIAALTEWLTIARDEYGVTVPLVSFNEADGGYSILLPEADARYFVVNGGAAFAKAGLQTKWLLGDTSNGGAFVPYATAILADKATHPYLGAASFHGWDSLSASDDSYRAIAALAKKHGKPVWCLEAGYDAQLWQRQPAVWDTWDNALKLAQGYARYLTLAEASVVDYWQYRNDYPLVGGKNGDEPFPSFHVLKMYTQAFPVGTKIVDTAGGADGLYTVAGIAPNGKLRLLLVNTGGRAGVALSGGRPGAAYVRDTRTRQTAEPPATRTLMPVVAADKSGRVSVSLPPRSVETLTEL